jgi:hypothetical protein
MPVSAFGLHYDLFRKRRAYKLTTLLFQSLVTIQPHCYVFTKLTRASDSAFRINTL